MLKLKKSIVVLMAILFSGLLATSVWAAGYEELEKKIEELSQAIQKLEGMVKELSFQIQQTQALSAIVKEFSFELKKTESAVRELEGINKKVQEDIQPRLLMLEGTIQGVAASFKEKFDVFQGRIFDLETTVQGLDARLKSLEGQVRQLLDLEQQLKQLEKRLQALEQQVKMAPPPQVLPNELVKQLKELGDRLQKVEGSVATLEEQFTQSRGRIASLEMNKADAEEVEALQARVDQLEQQLKTEVEKMRSQTTMITALAGIGLVAGLMALASVFGII